MTLLLKVIPSLLFWGIFVYVVLQVPYPETLTQANFSQITPFFVSLFLAITFSFNIFLKNILLSLTLSLGLIFLLALTALDSLNIVTLILTIIPVALLFSYFRKKRAGLTKQPKIPKLTKLQ